MLTKWRYDPNWAPPYFFFALRHSTVHGAAGALLHSRSLLSWHRFRLLGRAINCHSLFTLRFAWRIAIFRQAHHSHTHAHTHDIHRYKQMDHWRHVHFWVLHFVLRILLHLFAIHRYAAGIRKALLCGTTHKMQEAALKKAQRCRKLFRVCICAQKWSAYTHINVCVCVCMRVSVVCPRMGCPQSPKFTQLNSMGSALHRNIHCTNFAFGCMRALVRSKLKPKPLLKELYAGHFGFRVNIYCSQKLC